MCIALIIPVNVTGFRHSCIMVVECTIQSEAFNKDYLLYKVTMGLVVLVCTGRDGLCGVQLT
jgi:hypothetical protein